MRSPLSILSNVVDWQAASLALGVGIAMPATAKGARDAGAAIGQYGFATEIEALASSTVLRPFVELLRKHPDATHVTVEQNFKEEGGIRMTRLGVATLSCPGRPRFEQHPEILKKDWPTQVEGEDWDNISVEDPKIYFTLARADVDAFTIGSVVCWNALAEIVLQEHKMGCEPQYAAEHVRSAFSEARVSQGKPPLKWGAPGLHLIDAYLEHGGNPSAMDASGSTALAVAIYLQASDVVEKLVAAGADINAPAAAGLYPIDVAVLSAQPEMVRLCGELGASPNTPGYLQPSLRAIDMRSPAMLSELLELGAATDAETADGISLMAYAEDTNERERAQFMAVMTEFQIAAGMGAENVDDALEAAPRQARGMSL